MKYVVSVFMALGALSATLGCIYECAVKNNGDIASGLGFFAAALYVITGIYTFNLER
jgi:hypothetical protein